MLVKSMLRQYMRAYNWSYFKAQMKKYPQLLFFPVWLLVILVEIIFERDAQDTVVCLLVYLPLMHIFFAGILHSTVRLNKMLYLCPMDSARRKKFVYHSYFFRIAMNMVPAVAGGVAAYFLAPPNGLAVAVILCNDLLAACMLPWEVDVLASCMFSWEWDNKWKITKEMIYKLMIYHFVNIGNVMLTDILMDGGESRGMEIVPLGILFLIVLPLCIRYRKFVKAELEHAAEYEKQEGGGA